jgi:predicted PhzF superfamily epimerase YddE/YHI9
VADAGGRSFPLVRLLPFLADFLSLPSFLFLPFFLCFRLSCNLIHVNSGHATLATAHVLFSTSHPSARALRFRSRRSGDLLAVRDSSTGLISLDFPAGDFLTLESGHRRRPKIVEAVLKAAKKLEESEILRVAYSEFFGGSTIVELDASVDLKALAVEAEALVCLSFHLLPFLLKKLNLIALK